MEKYWIMSNIDVYKILCPRKSKKYEKSYGKIYGKEDVIYFESNPGRNVYLVSGGKVKLINYDEYGNEVVRQIIKKGELFGENILLGESVRDEFAVACGNKTRICDVNVEILQKLMRENKDFSTTIYKCIAFRIKKMSRRLELLIGKDARTRIIAFIYDMYKECDEVNVCNKLTQKEIACLLATSRESVARVFNDLKEKGTIEYDRKKIYIKDLQTLRKMAGA